MTMRVLLVPNTGNPVAVSAAAELAAWLLGQGMEPVLTQQDAVHSGLSDFGVAPTELGEPALVVALGGDGTILKAVHVLGDLEVPLLGVKFGRLGFLSGARAEEMRSAVEDALAGDARIERRATLRAEVVMDGRPVGAYRALNEVVVSRGQSGRVISLDVTLNGSLVQRVRADGVIVATATGSTAYALSAGGPVVSPGFGGMVVVPVAPHTLAARALVTDSADTVELVLNDPSRAEACLLVDGDAVPCRQAIERVTIARDPHDVLLVKLGGRDFYETLAAEFFGA
jgi:NAD+ kinase